VVLHAASYLKSGLNCPPRPKQNDRPAVALTGPSTIPDEPESALP
jgi:hypothetical protein